MHACQMIYKFQTVSLEQLQCLGVSSALNGYGMGLRRVLQTLRWICQPAGTQTSKELKWRQQVSLSIQLINNDKRAGRYEGLLTVSVQIGNQVPTSVSHVIALPMPSRNLRERSYSKIQSCSRAWHNLKFGKLCLRNCDSVFGTEADGAVSSDLNAMSSALCARARNKQTFSSKVESPGRSRDRKYEVLVLQHVSRSCTIISSRCCI